MRQVLKPNQKQTSSLVYFGNQNGQSVVEYLLILIVTLSLLLAFKPLFGGFGNFINDYVGEYTACLMEFGELPSLGVDATDLKLHESGGGKVCNTKFAAYTFSTGRQPIGSTGGSSTTNTKSSTGSTSSSSSSDSDRNSSRNASSNSSKSSSSDKSGSDSKSADDAASAAGRLNPYNSGRITRSSDYGRSGRGTTDGGGNDSASGSDNVKIIENAEKKDSALSDDYRNSSSRVSYERMRYKAITGEQQEEFAKRTKTAREPSSKIVTVIDDTGRMGPRKNTFIPPERKPTAVENKEEGFTLGSFMKWLIIAGMFIAIVLFFGGQVMNFMNSQEK